MNPATNRPAETGGIAGAIALLITYALGVTDPGVLTALGVIFASAPAAITGLVVWLRSLGVLKQPPPPGP